MDRGVTVRTYDVEWSLGRGGTGYMTLKAYDAQDAMMQVWVAWEQGSGNRILIVKPHDTETAAERTVRSLATMLGWSTVPPQDTLEAEIRALKDRATDHFNRVIKLRMALLRIANHSTEANVAEWARCAIRDSKDPE